MRCSSIRGNALEDLVVGLLNLRAHAGLEAGDAGDDDGHTHKRKRVINGSVLNGP